MMNLRRVGPNTTPVDLIVDGNEYADLRDRVGELEAENATLRGRRCPICDLPLTSEDDAMAHLEDLHGLAPASHELDRLRGEAERLRAALETADEALERAGLLSNPTGIWRTQERAHQIIRAALGREIE